MNPNRNLETAKQNEEYAAWQIEYATGAHLILMPQYSPFDYIVAKETNGCWQASALAEFRQRGNPKSAGPTVMIDVEKVDKIHAAMELMKVDRAIYIVKWLDTGYEWVSLVDTKPFIRKDDFQRFDEQLGDKPKDVWDIPVNLFREFV